MPSKTDLLFNFFADKTQLFDNYILDPVSGLKLYPKQSNCIRATALNTGFPISNAEIDLITEIESFFHHKLADLENFGFLFAAQNTGSPYATTGLYLTAGKSAYSWLWKGSASGGCAINASSLTDDNWYISNCYVGPTLSMKMRKVTIVNNALVIGSDINSTTTAKGTETPTSDLGILSGKSGANYVYSSKHKIGYIKIYGAGRTLMHHFVFSEGAETQVFDVVTGNSYTIANATLPNLWENKQDFVHNNFKNGFTLYQKTGSPDLRIPNKTDGSEIIPASIPNGYSRIANYKECQKTFNQCESLFCLDNTSAGGNNLVITNATKISEVNGTYAYNGIYNGQPSWFDATKNILIRRETSGYWRIIKVGSITYYESSVSIYADPRSVPYWWGSYGTDSLVLTYSSFLPSDLYSADPDHVLFTENTGVAKNIDVSDVYSDIVDLVKDRGHLYISQNSDKNMMLYKTDKGVGTPEDLKIWKYVK